MRVKLEYRDGKSDKEYHASLVGTTVTLSWGRRGSTLQTKREVCDSFFSAEAVWSGKIDEKIAKGYVVVASDVTALYPIRYTSIARMIEDEAVRIRDGNGFGPLPKKRQQRLPKRQTPPRVPSFERPIRAIDLDD